MSTKHWTSAADSVLENLRNRFGKHFEAFQFIGDTLLDDVIVAAVAREAMRVDGRITQIEQMAEVVSVVRATVYKSRGR